MICLVVLTQYRLVTDYQTYDDIIYRASIASRGKNQNLHFTDRLRYREIGSREQRLCKVQFVRSQTIATKSRIYEFVGNPPVAKIQFNEKLCYLTMRYVSQNLVNCKKKLYNKSTTNRSNGVRRLQLIDL